MEKKLLLAVLFCSALQAMDHEPAQFQLPRFTHVKAKNILQLPVTEGQPDYKYLTFDTADDGFHSALSELSHDIISLTLHTHPPTEAVALGAAPAVGKFELISNCFEPITGFDMSFNPENPKQKAFVVSRQKGWCTLFNFKNNSITDMQLPEEEKLVGAYFEDDQIVICVSQTRVYRFNFDTQLITPLQAPSTIPPSENTYITIPKNSLCQEPDEDSDDDESFHTCSSGDDDQQAEQAPRKSFCGRLQWLLFGKKPFRR